MMKLHFGAFATIRYLARLTIVASLLPVANVVAQKSPELRVMTYNLRYASANPPNAWPVRRPLVKDVIKKIEPDVFGTQEGLYHQVKELASDLSDYEWLGLGREGGSRGEFMAVFYRRDRLDPLAFDHFWLSDTPDVIGSTTWGNSNRRMVTWIKFRDLKSKQEFYFVNTHFDHEIQPAREKSATLVRNRIEALGTNVPVLLVGDFNAAAQKNKAYNILTEGGFLQDTWLLAKERKGEGLNTFNNFEMIRTNGVRIDWILARGDVDVKKSEIVTTSKDGQFPSDHFPVVSWLQFGSEK